MRQISESLPGLFSDKKAIAERTPALQSSWCWGSDIDSVICSIRPGWCAGRTCGCWTWCWADGGGNGEGRGPPPDLEAGLEARPGCCPPGGMTLMVGPAVPEVAPEAEALSWGPPHCHPGTLAHGVGGRTAANDISEWCNCKSSPFFDVIHMVYIENTRPDPPTKHGKTTDGGGSESRSPQVVDIVGPGAKSEMNASEKRCGHCPSSGMAKPSRHAFLSSGSLGQMAWLGHGVGWEMGAGHGSWMWGEAIIKSNTPDINTLTNGEHYCSFGRASRPECFLLWCQTPWVDVLWWGEI
ncbi:hypothetical protein DFP72DRAFT_853822 [Ephemerocybe angulata]|uniref:Uncharacterized protein n=1 Tax=Ephemerocybe angulata TaxID=980116 RepID=A0A8H6HKM5_9AGAR|nr:hypothetical protein DFP72DRAFT_853822 [Tulosesus angulatus]